MENQRGEGKEWEEREKCDLHIRIAVYAGKLLLHAAVR